MSGEDGVEITKRHRFGSWPVETAADCGWRYAADPNFKGKGIAAYANDMPIVWHT
jgi:hypothetical protein